MLSHNTWQWANEFNRVVHH